MEKISFLKDIEKDISSGNTEAALMNLIENLNHLTKEENNEELGKIREDVLLISAQYSFYSENLRNQTQGINELLILLNRINKSLLDILGAIRNCLRIKNQNLEKTIHLPNPLNIGIELTLDKKIDDYSVEEQRELLSKIKKLLAIQGEIKVRNVSIGSIKIIIEVSGDNQRDFEEKGLNLARLKELGVKNARILKSITKNIPTTSLLILGEGQLVEFKASLPKNKNAGYVITKTIAAFMNSHGGVILIGVTENGRIQGLDEITLNSIDKFFISILTLLRKSLGSYFLKFVEMQVEQISEKKIIRIDCYPSDIPVKYKDKNKSGNETEFFILRAGAMNISIFDIMVNSFVKERFKV